MKAQMMFAVLMSAMASAATLTVGEGLEYEDPHDALALVQDGDTVLILAGTYEFDQSLELWGRKDVAVIGGEGAVLVCNSRTENVMWIVNSDRVTVSGLRATHTMPEAEERCYGNVFAIDSCDSVTVMNCDICGCGAIGVYTFNCGDVFLRNNFIHDNTLWAVQYEGQNLLAEDSGIPGLTMEGNTIVNNGGRRTDMVLSKGTSTGELVDITNDGGYLVMVFTGSPRDRLSVCYLSPGCRGPWLDIFRDPGDYIGSMMEYEWRQVLTVFPPYDYGEEILEITSVRLPE
ncbi:MAG: right-handed parallel beta-helix repeat-containing protein [Candidatus Fermentibacteraceae bacterium]|nr:right-handed parallel beta-helix repeat-containing protein [Candidatus Fermentibacteraceae bacterium]MBN2609379.1 right-handed parallel beta-helix repeat-containing protein [Candidatus Fermentibacteraceae bacterium]